MLIPRGIVLLGVIILAGVGDCSLKVAWTDEQSLGRRNNEEDKAGPYIITNRDAATGKKDAQIRDFLWQHWRNHRRGRLVEKRYSKEGVPANSTLVIGPDESGVWTLRVATKWPPTKGSTREHDRIEYRVYSIRRIRPRRDSKSPVVFVSDEEERSGDTYWLVFYDEKGKEISAL